MEKLVYEATPNDIDFVGEIPGICAFYVGDQQSDIHIQHIVGAYNATYGNGINPEAVKEMYEALVDLTERVNKARNILQNPSSPSHGYWGILDTENATVVIDKAKLI